MFCTLIVNVDMGYEVIDI